MVSIPKNIKLMLTLALGVTLGGCGAATKSSRPMKSHHLDLEAAGKGVSCRAPARTPHGPLSGIASFCRKPPERLFYWNGDACALSHGCVVDRRGLQLYPTRRACEVAHAHCQ